MGQRLMQRPAFGPALGLAAPVFRRTRRHKIGEHAPHLRKVRRQRFRLEGGHAAPTSAMRYTACESGVVTASVVLLSAAVVNPFSSGNVWLCDNFDTRPAGSIWKCAQG